MIFQTKEKQIVTFSEVMWMDRIALQVKNEKVKAFLLSAQEYDKQVQVYVDNNSNNPTIQSIIQFGLFVYAI